MLGSYRLSVRSSFLLLAMACASGCGGSSEPPSGPEDSGHKDGTAAVDSGLAEDSSPPVDSTVPQDSGASDSTVDSGSMGADSAADTAVADSGIPDTEVADTAVADTSVADTSVADTSVADTAVADTGGAADSGVADTGSTDTGVGDTGAAETGSPESGSPEAGTEAGADAAPDATATYTISVSVSGLAAGDTLALKDNGTDQLFVTSNGTSPFATPVAAGAPYDVTVSGNPMAPISEACTVTSGSGVASSNVTVTVTCAPNTFTVGGTLVGTPAGTVILQNNLGDNLPLTSGGPFSFATKESAGSAYSVTVLTQPSSVVTCTVSGGTGTVGTGNVTSVTVTCAANVTGMIGYWNFDEASGTSAGDSSGNNLTGTLTGAAAFTPGAGKKGTGAITFSGGYVDVPFPNDAAGQGSGIFMPQGNVTYVMWIKTAAASLQGLQMIDGNTWGGGCDRIIGNSAGGVLNYEAWNEINITGSNAVNDGNYHQVVFVLDKANGFFGYVDGVADAVDPGGATGNCGEGCSGFNWASDYWIGTGGGCRGNVGNAFDGVIDDVRIYGRPLPASDVASLYLATK